MIVFDDNPVPYDSEDKDNMNEIKNAIKKLDVGQSFVTNYYQPFQNRSYGFARKINIKIKTCKNDDETLRIWRIA